MIFGLCSSCLSGWGLGWIAYHHMEQWRGYDVLLPLFTIFIRVISLALVEVDDPGIDVYPTGTT